MGENLNILRAVAVKDIIRHDKALIRDNNSVEELLELVLSKHRNVVFFRR